jgi:hypothetical protein
LEREDVDAETFARMVAGPPDADTADLREKDVLSLGLGGGVMFRVTGGALEDREGPDLYLDSPVGEASRENLADVFAGNGEGRLVSLGRVVTGSTRRVPLDLAVAGLSRAERFLIRDVHAVTDPERELFREYGDPFAGFDVDSIELAHAFRETEDREGRQR